MEKDNKLTYDEALQRAESIIANLEQAEALGMDEYKRQASEATALLQYCKSQIEGLSVEYAMTNATITGSRPENDLRTT